MFSQLKKFFIFVLFNNVLPLFDFVLGVFRPKLELLEPNAVQKSLVDIENGHKSHEEKSDREDPLIKTLSKELDIFDGAHYYKQSCLVDSGQLKEVVCDWNRKSHHHSTN
jgi:hypothetical protein